MQMFSWEISRENNVYVRMGYSFFLFAMGTTFVPDHFGAFLLLVVFHLSLDLGKPCQCQSNRKVSKSMNPGG